MMYAVRSFISYFSLGTFPSEKLLGLMKNISVYTPAIPSPLVTVPERFILLESSGVIGYYHFKPR